MEIIERIKDNFSRGFFGKSMSVPECPMEYPAWTLKQDNWIGVAVPTEVYKPFSEKFALVEICAEKDVQIDNTTYNLLILKIYSLKSRNEFALMCAHFVDPGFQGQARKELISNPEKYWNRWKEMLGNVAKNKQPYDVLGELMVLEHFIINNHAPRWTGADQATHDIEMDKTSVEVKSTISRYGYEITISSVYQLCPAQGKKLYLDFLRFEKSDFGSSVNDVADNLIRLGYDSSKLETALTRAGLGLGRVARNEKYRVLEWKRYPVDDNFPVITESSFKDDRLPRNVVRITYTVDLSGVAGQNQIQAEGRTRDV